MFVDKQTQAAENDYTKNIGWHDSYLVEFADAKDARRFIQEKSCNKIQGKQCGSEFLLSAFGSSGIVSLNLREAVSNLSRYVVGVVITIAIIIMAGTFGKIIADEKQERAIFRAIGVRRIDLTMIYVYYAVMLSLLAVLAAILIGFVLASLLHVAFADDFTIAMRLIYGVLNESMTARLVAIDMPSVFFVALVAILAGIASMILPLQRIINSDIVQDLKSKWDAINLIKITEYENWKPQKTLYFTHFSV